MASWHIDSSRPSIVIHTVEGTFTDREVDDYLREGTEVFLRSGRHVTILDASKLGLASAYVRSRNAAWFKTHRARLETSCVGLAYVISSPLLRFISMTVKRVIRLPVPWAVCKSREEALAWSEARLTGNAP